MCVASQTICLMYIYFTDNLGSVYACVTTTNDYFVKKLIFANNYTFVNTIKQLQNHYDVIKIFEYFNDYRNANV